MADLLAPEVDAGLAPAPEGGIEPTAEVEGPLGSKLSLTADDVPELSDLQPGDSITFTLDDVTEDGNYSLTVAPAAPEEELPPLPPEGELGAEPALGGQEAVLDQLV